MDTPIAGSKRLGRVWCVLKCTYGLAAIIAGLDKFFSVLTVWEMYASPLLVRFVPLDVTSVIQVAGVIEIVAGVLILSKLTRVGAYVMMAWLLAVAGYLLASGGFFDVALRNVVMAMGAFALAQLTAVKEGRK